MQLHIVVRAFARPGMTVLGSRPQHILLHLAAVEMEKRHRRVVAEGAGGETLFEFTQDVFGHGVQVGERF